MAGVGSQLDALTRPERRALRDVLVRSTAVAGRLPRDDRLAVAVRTAPMSALPAAAALHRVGGTVLRGLDGIDAVPCDVTNELAAQRRNAGLRHLIVVGALSQIGNRLDDAGVSWVAMKGPVVADLFYPDVGDRAYADLDLLVGRHDFPLAMRTLEELGYTHSIHDWARAEEMLAGQVSMNTAAVTVDLHWHLHYSREDRRPFAIDTETMLERARRVVVSGVSVPTLDPVDTLLSLAFHAARSDGHRLVWLKDIERAIAVDGPDFEELVRRCDAYRCGPPVGLMLGRAANLIGAEVPAAALNALTPRSLRGAERVSSIVSDPVPLHERPTVTRWLTRSTRSSAITTVGAVPARGVRMLRRCLFPPPPNETDDLGEKARYLNAVTSATE
jgi:hypothetical protein